MAEQGIRISVRAAIVRDGALLLVECEDEQGRFYTVPGGGLESGETLHEALAREIREETGAEITIGDLLLVCERIHRAEDDYWHALNMIYRCTLASDAIGPLFLDPFQTGIRWLPLDELGDFTVYPPVVDALMPALQMPRNQVFLDDCLTQPIDTSR